MLAALFVCSLTACGGDPCGLELPYDGIDQDCDGSDLTDVDGDGVDGIQAGGADCDDGNAQINPGMVDVPYDGIDQDCSGADLIDADGDGYNYAGEPINGDDCDDDDEAINPAAQDTVGDGIDQNCDGVDGVDLDGDGFAGLPSGGDDCNDFIQEGGAGIYPGATEIWYDGVDQDCAGDCDFDKDGDGFLLQNYTPVDNGPCDDEPKYAKIAFTSDCDDEDDAATDNFLFATTPPTGDANVYGAAPVLAQLVRPETGATLVVTDDFGKTVPGVTRFEGNDLTFYPDASLEPFVTHDAAVTWSCGTVVWAFTVGAFGPPANVSDVDDTTYDMSLDSGFVRRPIGLGAAIEAAFDRHWLLWAKSASASSITLVQATAEATGKAQDECLVTAAWAPTSFTANPEVSTGAVDVTLPIITGPVPVYDATLDGLFSPAGDLFGKATLQGEIDTRDFIDALAPGGADDTLCVQEAKYGGACSACSDGTGTFCLELIIDDLAASAASITTVERSPGDIGGDATCDP